MELNLGQRLTKKVGIKVVLCLFLSLFSIFAKADISKLRAGDIVLQNLDCWSCSLIEAQEDSIYSHIGIALDVGGEIFIAEAYGVVKLTKVEDFLNRSPHPVKILRLKSKKHLVLNFEDLTEKYFNFFHQKQYDAHFLWNNDAIYCSELVYKLLYPILENKMFPKIMHFDINREGWLKYFKGNIPVNEIGVSPADFDRSKMFFEI